MDERSETMQFPSDEGFPHKGTPAEKLSFLLHYAILAPSSHNTQPWTFSIDGDTLLLYANMERTLPVLDPNGREVIISCGAALFYLRVALHHFGHRGNICLLPDKDHPTLLARIELGEVYMASEGEEELFHAIQLRHTNRQPYTIHPVPYDIVALLRAAAQAEGAWMVVLDTLISRTILAQVIADAQTKLDADPRYQQMQAAWVASGYSHVPPLAFVPTENETDTSIHVHTSDLTGRTIATQAPLLVLLGTEGDTPKDWVMAGQALARVLLRASSYGIAAAFLNQPLEVPELRRFVDNTWSRAGYAQLVLRFGYGPPAPPTPRYPVSEVML